MPLRRCGGVMLFWIITAVWRPFNTTTHSDVDIRFGERRQPLWIATALAVLFPRRYANMTSKRYIARHVPTEQPEPSPMRESAKLSFNPAAYVISYRSIPTDEPLKLTRNY